MSFTNPTTASTSVVLVPTATSNSPYYIYLNNVSTAGRIVTVRDNDGFASPTNRIVVAPINGAYFVDGTSSITINQSYGYITFNTALNGGYGILNTFGFPAGSAAAFVSNVTSCNFTTSTIGAQFISAPTGVFNIINTNIISTASILVNNFTPSTIAANGISTGVIAGGSASFQTIFGSSITTNSLSLASLTTGTGNFTNVITTNTTTTNLAFTDGVAISALGSNIQIGSNTAVGSRGVAIGGNTKAAVDAVSLGFAAGSNNQGTMATSVGAFAGATNQGASAVAVGYSAGSNAQGVNATSVGYLAGSIAQGVSAVALGDNAGYQNQANAAIAIGAGTGQFSQGIGAISIGGGAGQNSQANGAIAIGAGAGQFSQGASSIAIGVIAGQTSQHANTIILNATGSTLDSATTNSVYISPIRDDQTGVGSRVAVYYNQATKEMTTGPATGTNLLVSSIITSSIVTNGLTTTQLIAATLQTNTISTSLITGTGISSLSISTGTTLTGTLQTNTISSGIASFGLGNVSTINTNSISTASLNLGSLNVNSLSTGSIVLAIASIGSIATNTISSGTLTVNSGTISTFTAGSIVANTERVGSLSTNFISANTVNITGPTSMINARTQSIFVVNGNDSSTDLKYSLDGITWCNSVTNGGFSGSGSGVAWNGSLFVALGGDTLAANTIKYSSDGSNWFNSASGGFTISGASVAWNGRMWVATGEDSSSQGRIKYSFNGSNWFNANTTTFTNYARGLAWGNGQWVVAGGDAGGAANSIMTSSDGSNWSFATNTTGNAAWGGPAYNGSYWLMGATGVNSNAILYSSNAINWNRVESTSFTIGCYQLGWNGSYWVALGEGGVTIQTSQNGMVWTPATSGLFGNFGQAIVWNGSFWLAAGYQALNPNASVKYSRDGLNWTNTVFGVIPYVGSANGIAYTNQLVADVATQELNLYSQNVPNVLQSTNQIVALTSSLVLNNTLYVNRPANYVGINASVPQAPLHVIGGMNGQTSQIMLQTVGSTLNTSLYVSTNVGQATLGVVGPSNGFMTGTVPGDTALTTARTSNRLVMGNGTQIGLFISSGTVVVPGTLSIGGSISTASISTGSASFNNITVASSTLVSTLFFTGDVSIQASTDEIRIGSNAGITGQGRGAVALGAAAGQTTQGASGIAIGSNAGQTSQGANSIAIGGAAGQTSQHANTIILNASGTALNSATTNAFYVAPIRDDQGITGARTLAYYNATTKEITTGPTTNLALSSLTVAGAVAFPSVSTNTLSTTTVNTATLNASGSAFISSGLTLAGDVAYGALKLRNGASTNEIFIADPGRTDFTGWLVGEDPNYASISTFGICRVAGGTVQPQTGLFIASNGNMGIGISSPLFSLDIAGQTRIVAQGSISTSRYGVRNPGTDSLLVISACNAYQGGVASIFFGLTTNNNYPLARIAAIDNQSTIGGGFNSELVFQTNQNSGTSMVESMRINHLGNLGIGTSTPQYKLDVAGIANVSYNKGYIRFGQWEGMTFIHGNSNGASFIWYNNNISGGGVSRDTYTLFGYPPTGGAYRVMEVSTNGIATFSSNVGINAYPSYQLDVNGITYSRSTLLIGNSGTQNTLRFYGTSGDEPGQFRTSVIGERIRNGENSELVLFKGNDGVNDNVRVIAAGAFRVDVGTSDAANFFWQQGGNPPTANYPNALVVDTNGYVGIGDVAPIMPLHVKATVSAEPYTQILIEGTGSFPNGGYGLSNTSGWGRFAISGGPGNYISGSLIGDICLETRTTNKKILFGNNAGGLGMCLSNNRLGIGGITSPGYSLEVNGVIATTSAVNDTALSFASGYGTFGSIEATNINNSTKRPLILNGYGGNVGIGNIATPSYKLDVTGNIRATTSIQLNDNNASGSIGLFLGSTGDFRGYISFFNSAGTRQGYIGWAADPTTYIAMHSENGGIGYQVTSNFKVNYRLGVGLGSVSPAVPLDVTGRGRVLAQGSSNNGKFQFGIGQDSFCIQSSSNQYNGGIASLFFGSATSDYPFGRIYCQEAQPTSGGAYYGRMAFMVCNGNQFLTEAMRIDSNLRVGINFTAPTQTLTVGGSAGKTDGPSWSTASDQRIKTDITSADINRCYSDIYRLNLRRYTYTSSYMSTVQLDDKYSLGFIAQEVSTIMPKMVSAGAAYGFDDFQWVNYGQLSFAHYGATQKLMHITEEQSTIIQTLTSQVAELQQTVSTLVGRATV